MILFTFFSIVISAILFLCVDHCMLSFVKPNLLGTSKEFRNRFVNPIMNGQYDDSTDYDVKLMKKRIHILHKLLEGCVHVSLLHMCFLICVLYGLNIGLCLMFISINSLLIISSYIFIYNHIYFFLYSLICHAFKILFRRYILKHK